MAAPVLTVEDLRISFPLAGGTDFYAVAGVSLEVSAGETLGIVGESGSGKTMLALSLMGLVPQPGKVTGRGISLLDHAILGKSEKCLSDIRGRDVSMIFQDPMTSLNPVRRVGSLLEESLLRHGRMTRAQARDRALQAFREVGIPSPETRLNAYPHELSGGLRQRAMIALALVNHPPLIIADEPTTALDATIQAQILELLRTRLENAALILITHDLGVAAEICDRVAVMYYGNIVETGNMKEILHRPVHPYTAGLLAAAPKFDFTRPELMPIPGTPPGSGERLSGCAFRPRCSHASEACSISPHLVGVSGHLAACHHPLTEAATNEG